MRLSCYVSYCRSKEAEDELNVLVKLGRYSLVKESCADNDNATR